MPFCNTHFLYGHVPIVFAWSAWWCTIWWGGDRRGNLEPKVSGLFLFSVPFVDCVNDAFSWASFCFDSVKKPAFLFLTSWHHCALYTFKPFCSPKRLKKSDWNLNTKCLLLRRHMNSGISTTCTLLIYHFLNVCRNLNQIFYRRMLLFQTVTLAEVTLLISRFCSRKFLLGPKYGCFYT